MNDTANVLVVNSGSTSLKLKIVAADGDATAVHSFAEASTCGVRAVGHRVVHGGVRFHDHVVIDDRVRDEIETLMPWAPLHNRSALAAIDAARQALPDVPHVAVFDTAFHRTIPEAASVYAVPRRWRDEWAVRRFGFHGLSVAWCSERVAALLGRPARRFATGRVPSRRRLLDYRGSRRPLGRHHDGVQPARRRADDDSLGIDRRGRADLSAA